ncbi:MAG: fused MFS/spermidine synthase [Candidatus Omnitrophica bacterium]|nr:fused MFS/spermidine synthase [Candidatus Omnitrophota bacterium]
MVVFTAAVFVSAFLLFSIQPMFAKMLLPLLGGAPAVWNTCLVFFQAMLLAGYAYAHWCATRWEARRQTLLHLVLLTLPLWLLPIRLPEGWIPPHSGNPIPALLAMMPLSVGVPFMLVSTSAPLLQRWFAATDHPHAANPYVLYAASNLGSFLALISYPWLIEPRWRLADQSALWGVGYILLVGLCAGCALLVWRRQRASPQATPLKTGPAAAVGTATPIPWGRRWRWVILACVPSSLMLGVTTYLSTDIAAIPLLWIIPLGLYLLTFVLVFSDATPLPHWLMVRLMPGAVILMGVALTSHAIRPTALLLGLHLVTFFLTCMVCHGELAKDRPPPQQLTSFYLWMSVGGVLGGMFNALAAPLIFQTAVEYPLAMILACTLLPPDPEEEETSLWWLDYAWPVAIGLLVLALYLTVPRIPELPTAAQWFLLWGVPPIICYPFRRRPIRFGLCLGAWIFIGTILAETMYKTTLEVRRSFFGIYVVERERTDGRVFHRLVHGTTLHGKQDRDPARQREPLTYFSRLGPMSQVFDAYVAHGAPPRVAIIGLGAGSLGCYARPGEEWAFYEIDPTVLQLASNPAYFSYLEQCAPSARVILGDGRLSLAQAPEGHYGLLIVDAFSSDAVPIHLITRDAVQLYFSKLGPHGVLALNISNRYLDFRPVLGNIATSLGAVAMIREHRDIPLDAFKAGVTGSVWAAMARGEEDVGELLRDPRWKRAPVQPRLGVWTDDFSNVASVFRPQ